MSRIDESKTPFEVNSQMASWVVIIMPLAALAGALIGGSLIEYFGRKLTILGTGIPFVIAWLLMSFANSIVMFLIGEKCTVRLK